MQPKRLPVDREERLVEFLSAAASEATQLEVPDSLADRIRLELEEPAVRVARHFARLEPLQAPTELDASVAERLSDLVPARDTEEWEARSGAVRALRSLPRQAVPQVLDRLVEEELARPAQSIAERYVGGLSPLSAPDLLTERCQSVLEGRGVTGNTERTGVRPPLVRVASVLAPLAAALLIVVALRASRSDAPEATAGWRFEMVFVEDPAELGPAKGLLRGVAGGVLPEDVR